MSDWIDILEVAYDMTGDDRTWLQAVANVARPELDCGLGVVAYFFDASGARLKIFDYVAADAPPEAIDFARQVHSHPMWRSSEMLRATYRSPSALRYSMDMGDNRMQDLLSVTGRPSPWGRVLLLNAADPSHRGCVLGAVDLGSSAVTLKRKESWSRVAAHMAAGLRLRRRLAELNEPAGPEEAILSPSGTLLHAEGPAKTRIARDALRDATLAIDKARGRLRRSDPEAALNLWRGMLEGRWSLIDRFERDGRRLVVAHRNNVATRGLRALTLRERQVAAYAALGHSNKLIAYELGLTLGSVGTHLTSALAKLGAKSRLELIQIAASLGAPGSAVKKRESSVVR